MAKLTDKERVQAWEKRAISAGKVHKEWAEEFDCDTLEQFYYGHQHPSENADFDDRKYSINMYWSAINISRPSMLFGTPTYTVKPRPNRIDDPMSDSAARAKLQETTLNSFVQDPKLGFEDEAALAILDAHFRFGVIEVGYTADYIDNPNAGKPMLNDRNEQMADGDGAPVKQPDVNVRSESLFLKWIPGKNFRVADNAPNRLTGSDWCGYPEWHLVDDLKANKRYKNTANLKATAKLREDSTGNTTMADGEENKAGMVKVWKIWDNRAKKRYVFVAGGEKFLLEEPIKFLPFAVLKMSERLGKFYPTPESYNWLHPQRELNDTREMQRVHRKRAPRRYRRRDSVEESEFNKLLTNEDMVCIVTANENDVTPILDAPLDAAVARNVPQSQDDFTRVSGISGEEQQVAQSETATQANLIALASKVRESSRRRVVSQWLSDLGRVMLLTLVDKMALPFWIQKNVDPASPLAMEEAMEIAGLWESIEAEQLGDIDNDISVEISSLSPVAQQQEREEFFGFLGVLKDPMIGTLMAVSPYLLRKISGMFNIHNERDLVEISKATTMVALMSAGGGMGGGAPKGQGGAAAPGPTPSMEDTQGQLQQQLPVEVSQQ